MNMFMSPPPRPRPDQLLNLVRDRIIANRAEPGSWIKQDRLAADLGVSKIPLREALVRLEQEGLVTSQTNRGYFVSPLSRAEAEEVFALRLQLEPKATEIGAHRATGAEQAACVETLERLAIAMREGEATVPSLNRAFHIALVRPGDQPVTTAFIERLHVLSERYVRKHLEPLGRGPQAVSEHDDIMAAWLARDGARAGTLTRRHISQTLRDLVRQLPA